MRLAVGWAQLVRAALIQPPFKGAHCGPQTSIRSAKLQEPPANMKLSAEDKHNVKAIWDHIKGHEEALGAEALCRMFASSPTTKTYFPAKDLQEGSSYLHSHGKKVMGALTNAVAHIDDIDGALCKLSDKHAQELMVDPANFPKLSHHILVVLGIHLKPHLTYAVHCSVDKFLAIVGYVLASKYR